jgi:hemolysin III
MTRPQRLGEISEAFGEQIRGRVEEIQPGLRGWLHAATFPVAVVAGVVLVVAAPTPTARVGAAVFAVSAALLFGVSAAYHRGHWSPRSFAVLRRIDHSSIFVLIAGTYTAFSLLLLTGSDRLVLLALVWTGAVAGVLFRVLWLDAPRWVYLPAYLGLGWVAVFWLGDFARTAGATVLVLIVLGGALYSLGGLVYGLRRPDPAPAWFGFHELFHTLTVAAFAVHYIGISMATYRLA